MDPRLLILRVALFAAAQTLTGADAAEFWKLIDEVQMIRVLHDPAARRPPLPGTGPDPGAD